MSEKQQNLQDTFLNAVRKSKSAVTIFLVNGVKLQGNITWFDNFCVLLRRDGQAQLVYKHAISTVMPMGPIQLQDEAAHEVRLTLPSVRTSAGTAFVIHVEPKNRGASAALRDARGAAGGSGRADRRHRPAMWSRRASRRWRGRRRRPCIGIGQGGGDRARLARAA